MSASVSPSDPRLPVAAVVSNPMLLTPCSTSSAPVRSRKTWWPSSSMPSGTHSASAGIRSFFDPWIRRKMVPAFPAATEAANAAVWHLQAACLRTTPAARSCSKR